MVSISGFGNIPEKQEEKEKLEVSDDLSECLEEDLGCFANLPQYKRQKWEFLEKTEKEKFENF